MKVILITQDDPFYLGRNLEFLIRELPEGATVCGYVSGKVSPFGKPESFPKRMMKTYKVFGAYFFLRYGLRYVISMLSRRSNVDNVMRRYSIPKIGISESINSATTLMKIKGYYPDLLISIGGNEIFKKDLLNIAPLGCLNLHTAPLPKYRGLMPSFWVLKNRETRTAVTVFFVDEGVDSGPIFVQEEVEIGGMSQAELIAVTKQIGMKCVVRAVEKLLSNDTETLPNNDAEMTYYGFPTRGDVDEFRRAGARFF
jgi:methionyl-tRNA formyltransferase